MPSTRKGGPGPAAALLLCGALFAFAVGFVAGDQDWIPPRYVVPAKDFIKGWIPVAPPPAMSSRTVATGHLLLDIGEVPVTVRREGAGGGLTSAGTELLLLTHEGTIHRVDGTSVRPTAIEPPDNGYAAYEAASRSDRFNDLTHNLRWFRYNDILYFENAEGASLAVSYTEWHAAAECYTTTVARLDLGRSPPSMAGVQAGPDDWTILFRTRPCLPLKRSMRALEGHMAGGRLAFAPPATIVLGSGDYHWDGVYAPEALAQNPRNDYGKVIDINARTGESAHLSVGNRNVQGLVLDSSGRLWGVEHGPRGGDELNRILPGSNHGWPLTTLGTGYDEMPWPGTEAYGRHSGFDAPVFAWLPSIGISNITEVMGFDPTWDGDLLVASLKAGSLFRVRVREDHVEFVEPIPVGQPIRYVHQHTDGRIVAWTDEHRLLFLSRSEVTPAAARLDKLIGEQDLTARRRAALST
ncbi:MAG: PQQ-dependent sugar dehydrogenase, partial [Gemmatimonadota bacterium]|nr:PQQ-dependent sugar dehydrogenase [Gemmatimonadota bacterium]